MKDWLKLMLACGILLAFPAISQESASADTFPGNYDARLADSSYTNWCNTSSFSSYSSISYYAVYSTLRATTDMTSASGPGSCYNSTDLWFANVNLTGALRGERKCAVASSSTRCDRSTIDMDIAQLDVGSNDWYDRRKTAIHEVGHSVGANHDSGSTMISGEVPSTALQWRRYSTHDVGHINANY